MGLVQTIVSSRYLQVQTSVFSSGDQVPDFALHFWCAITKKVECVGYSPSNDYNDDGCCHTAFHSFIIFAIYCL